MSAHSESQARRWSPAVFTVVALVFAVFAGVRHALFLNLDDNIYISENPYVANGLRWEGVRWAFSRVHGGHWHPLTWLSHMADVQLFGLNPAAHHLENVVWHAANSALVLLLLLRTTANYGRALVVALLFALHPLRIESVAWAAERKDVLSVFFAMLAFHCYVSFVRNRRALSYGGLLAAFALSLLAKPTLMTLPILACILDIWPLERITVCGLTQPRLVWPLLREKLPLLALSLASSLAATFAQAADGGLKSLDEYPLGARVANALASYVIYAGKLFLPLQMGIFYPFRIYPPGVGAGALLALLALSALIFGERRSCPALFAGWLWFLVALFPMVGFVQFGGQSFADRWTYLPHLGLLCGVVWWCADRMPARTGAAVSGLLILAAAGQTWRNIPYWRDSETLFRHTNEVCPDNFLALNNLGAAVDAAGRIEEAQTYFEQAVQLRPSYPEALNNLGTVYARRGRLQDGRELFRRALTIEPQMLAARYHFGLAAVELGDSYGGIVEWARVLSADPTYSRATQSLGTVLPRLLATDCQRAIPETERRALLELREVTSGMQDSPTRGLLIQLLACHPA